MWCFLFVSKLCSATYLRFFHTLLIFKMYIFKSLSKSFKHNDMQRTFSYMAGLRYSTFCPFLIKGCRPLNKNNRRKMNNIVCGKKKVEKYC